MGMKASWVLGVALSILLTGAHLVQAESLSSADLRTVIQEQNKKIEALLNRVEELESRQEMDAAKAAAQFVRSEEQSQQISGLVSKMEKVDRLELKPKLWAENISFSGDLRYRYEFIDEEGKDNRNRNRVRMRVGLKAKVSDELDLGFRMATGNDPDALSTNQTLTGSFSKKNLWLDLAYFDWHPEQLEGLNIYGGKMKNPFYTPGKTELIWDGDLNPEGIALSYRKQLDSLELFANAGGFWLEERSSDADSALWGAQAGLKANLTEDVHVLGGLSVYDFSNTKGNKVFGVSGKSLGNTSYPVGSDLYYSNDYRLMEGFAELGFKVCDKPAAIFANYVKNTEVDEEDRAYLFGASLGKCKDPGSWQLRYNYRQVEKDSVLGAFTDSDFIGGGTNGRGHEIGVDYQLTKPVKLGLSYFMNEKNLTAEKEYNRLQLDMNYKF